MTISMHVYLERRDRETGMWTYQLPPGVVAFQFNGGKQLPSIPRPTDWYSDREQCNPDTMFVFYAGQNNDEGFRQIAPWRGEPEGMSPEMTEVVTCTNEGCSWLLLSELKSYDLDHPVSKVIRRFTDDELAQCSERGASGVRVDIQSHRWQGWRSSGYEEAQVPVRDCVPDLIELIDLIERSCPSIPAEDIRLVFWFD